MDNIGITSVKYQDNKSFDENTFEHRDARIMDRFSKIAMSVARHLYGEAKGNQISPRRLAVVLATCTGPRAAIEEFHEIIASKGYIGVNPSKFPNTMLSTPLSRITIELQAKGPSVPLYITGGKMKQAVQYGKVQIKRGRCDAAVILYPYEDRGCFGLFLESLPHAKQRGMNIRFYLRKEWVV